MAPETKERILAVAEEMFIERGIRLVRMDDIARKCGVSKRTIYELFNDREEIIEQALLNHAVKDHAHNKELANRGENILHGFWLIFTQGDKSGLKSHTLIDELHRYYPKVSRNLMMMVHEEVVKHTRTQLTKGIEEGLIMPHLDTEFFARALTNYIYGLGIIEANTSITGVVINEHTLPYAVLVFMRGISTEKGREYIDNNLLNSKYKNN